METDTGNRVKGRPALPGRGERGERKIDRGEKGWVIPASLRLISDNPRRKASLLADFNLIGAA